MASAGSRRDASDRHRERDRDKNLRGPSPSPPPPTTMGKHKPNYLKPTISSLHEGHDVCCSCKQGAKQVGCHLPSTGTGKTLPRANKSAENLAAQARRARSHRTSPDGGTAAKRGASPSTKTPAPHLRPVVTASFKHQTRPGGKVVINPAATKAGDGKENKVKSALSCPATGGGDRNGAGTQAVEAEATEEAIFEPGLLTTSANAVTSDDHVAQKENEKEAYENYGGVRQQPQSREKEQENVDVSIPSKEEQPLPGKTNDLFQVGEQIHKEVERQQPVADPQETVIVVVEEDRDGASTEQTVEETGINRENNSNSGSLVNKIKVVRNADGLQSPHRKDSPASNPGMDADLERKLMHRKAWETDGHHQQHAQVGAEDSPSAKRESPAYNSVIEETASKLVAENRKNKVLALVGGFETVISLQEPNTPRSPIIPSGAQAEEKAANETGKEESVSDAAGAALSVLTTEPEVEIRTKGETDAGTTEPNKPKKEEDPEQGQSD